MADPRFFRPAKRYRVAEIAELTGAEIGGAGDAARLLEDVAPLEVAGEHHLSFLSNPRYAAAVGKSRAGAIFVHPKLASKASSQTTLLLSPKPYLAFARAARLFHPDQPPADGIAPSAVVHPTARLGHGVTVGANAVIEAGVTIGDRSHIGATSVIGAGVVIGCDCRIHPGVTVSHCLMGDRVALLPGVRVGQDGFGFALDPDGYVRIPQLGRVIIGDDVEIGANSTVDRGAGPDTVIGAGSIIDNLVQIAHNVVLGRGCILVSQCGIAGSSRLGDFVEVGGQVGVVGHLSVGDGARLAGQSGVMRDVAPGTAMGGSPAVPLKQWHRQTAILDRLAKKEDKQG
jgi:UDP-3-O-[3-hydroxymyristoyl] glucosamine N-acyltransferase